MVGGWLVFFLQSFWLFQKTACQPSPGLLSWPCGLKILKLGRLSQDLGTTTYQMNHKIGVHWPLFLSQSPHPRTLSHSPPPSLTTLTPTHPHPPPAPYPPPSTHHPTHRKQSSEDRSRLSAKPDLMSLTMPQCGGGMAGNLHR